MMADVSGKTGTPSLLGESDVSQRCVEFLSHYYGERELVSDQVVSRSVSDFSDDRFVVLEE